SCNPVERIFHLIRFPYESPHCPSFFYLFFLPFDYSTVLFQIQRKYFLVFPQLRFKAVYNKKERKTNTQRILKKKRSESHEFHYSYFAKRLGITWTRLLYGQCPCGRVRC